MLRDGWESLISEGKEQLRSGALKHLAVGVVAHSMTAALLLQRGPKCYLPDQYEFPNDVLRAGETLEAGIARILAQQAGLEVKLYGGYLGTHDYENSSGEATRMFVFWVEVLRPAPIKLAPEFSHGVFAYFDEVHRYGIIDPFASFLMRLWFGGEIEPPFLTALIEEAKAAGFWRHKVRLAVRRDDGSLLLLKRPRRARSWAMLYECPGGDLDFGESLIEAGARHLLRQTNLELDQMLEYLGHFDYTSQRDLVDVREFLFLCEAKSAASFTISEHAHGAYADMRQFRSAQVTSSCAMHVQGFYDRFFGALLEAAANA